MARKSSTNATGAPWKFPFDSTRLFVEQDDRVVDDRGEFALGDGGCVSERVTRSAGYLRRATQ